MTRTSGATRSSWLAMWAAFSAAPVVYLVVALQIVGSVPASPALPMLRLLLALLALPVLGAGIVMMQRAGRARTDAPLVGLLSPGEAVAEPRAFQAAFVIATALVESVAIYGFLLIFLGGTVTDYLPFGGAALLVLLAVGLPAGLRYWSERAGSAPQPGGARPIE